MSMTIEQARKLMHEWTPSEALRGHMEAVAACMGAYAEKLEPDNHNDWVVCGLLHDFDYERHPTRDEHPFIGVKHLESLGVSEEIRLAILGHAPYSGVPRDSKMAKALFACDELSGLIVAICKVRPSGIDDLAPKSVKKKLKEKAFAAAVSREDIAMGVDEFAPEAGVDLTGHIQVCIDAIRGARERVGL